MAKRSTNAKIVKNDDETVDVTLLEDNSEEKGGPDISPTAGELAEQQAASEGEPEQKENEATEQDSTEDEEKELSEYSEGVQKRISKLTRKMREAERREKAALEYAKSLKNQYDTSTEQAQVNSANYLSEYEARLALEESTLKSTLHKAIETGDVNTQMEVQKRIAQHAIDTERLNSAKAYKEHQVPDQQPAQTAPQEQQPPVVDVKAERWAETNQWFGEDEPMTLTAFKIHDTLVKGEGYDPRSDSYYQELDHRIREEFPHKFSGSAQQSRRPSSVAPAGGARAGRGGKTSVKLKPSQVAIARKLGVSLDDYARQVSKLANT